VEARSPPRRGCARAKAPEADLFIRRGELFRHNQEWAKAEADFAAAARMEPKLAIVDFFHARAQFEAGAPEKARPLIDRCLASTPGEAEAWFLRGEIFAALGPPAAGAGDYADGIRRAAPRRGACGRFADCAHGARRGHRAA